MTTLTKFFARFAILSGIAGPLLTLAPAYAAAAPSAISTFTTTTHTATSTLVTTTTSTYSGAGFNPSSLIVATGTEATISGVSPTQTVRVAIEAPGSASPLYTSGIIGVHNGRWEDPLTMKLPVGSYTVTLTQPDATSTFPGIATSTMYVGGQPPIVKVLPIPLLGGGVAQPGTIVPISYLQVANLNDATTTLHAFWIKEDGTAPESAVTSLTSIDGTGAYQGSVGGIEGQTPFMNGLAYVPIGTMLGPHQYQVFTLKAQLSASAGQYAGTTLGLDIAGLDIAAGSSNAFPVKGTAWVVSR